MPASMEINARDAAKRLQNARQRFISGPLALGVQDYALKVTLRARTKSYGFTDRTGRLRSSIRAPGAELSADRDFVTATVGSNVFYAPYVERNYGRKYSYIRRAIRELGTEEYRRSIERHTIPWLRREGLAP